MDKFRAMTTVLLAVPVLLWVGAVNAGGLVPGYGYNYAKLNNVFHLESYYGANRNKQETSRPIKLKMVCYDKNGNIPKRSNFDHLNGPWIVDERTHGFREGKNYYGKRCAKGEIGIYGEKYDKATKQRVTTLITKFKSCKKKAHLIRVLDVNEHRTGVKLRHGCVGWDTDAPIPGIDWEGYETFDNRARGPNSVFYPAHADRTFYVMVQPNLKHATPVDFSCYREDTNPDSLTDNRGRYKHWLRRADNTEFPKTLAVDNVESGFHYRGKGCKGKNAYVDVHMANSNATVARLQPCENKVRYARVVAFDDPNARMPRGMNLLQMKPKQGIKLLTTCIEPWKQGSIPDVDWDGWEVIDTLTPTEEEYRAGFDNTVRVVMSKSMRERKSYHEPQIECRAKKRKNRWTLNNAMDGDDSQNVFRSDYKIDSRRIKRCDGIVKVSLFQISRKTGPRWLKIADLPPCPGKLRYAVITDQSGGHNPKNPPGTRMLTGCIEPWYEGLPVRSDWSVLKERARRIQVRWPGQEDYDLSF